MVIYMMQIMTSTDCGACDGIQGYEEHAQGYVDWMHDYHILRKTVRRL